MYTFTVQSAPPLLMLHSCPTLLSKPLIPHLPILYLLPLPPHHRPLLLAALLHLLTPGFFNGMLEIFEPGALNYFTFFCPILSTLSASRNPIVTHLPLSRFLDSLLCVLITPTPGLAFSLLMTRTLAAAWSFSSGRAYSFLNFLPPLFLCLIPTDYVRVNISLNNSSSVSFLNVYAPLFAPPQRMAELTSFLPPFFPTPKISILGDFNCHHPLWDSRGTSDPCREEVFNWVISSDLLPLNDPDTPTLLHCSSGSRSSLDIFAPFSLALSRS